MLNLSPPFLSPPSCTTLGAVNLLQAHAPITSSNNQPHRRQIFSPFGSGYDGANSILFFWVGQLNVSAKGATLKTILDMTSQKDNQIIWAKFAPRVRHSCSPTLNPTKKISQHILFCLAFRKRNRIVGRCRSCHSSPADLLKELQPPGVLAKSR